MWFLSVLAWREGATSQYFCAGESYLKDKKLYALWAALME